MRVSFVAPNSDNDIAYYVKPYHGCENVGIHVLASLLRNEGHEVQILDCTALSIDQSKTLSSINKFKPDIVGFSPTICSIQETLQMSSSVKKWNPDTLIILGGHHASLCAEDILTLDTSIDIIFYSEAEDSLLGLIKKIEKKENLSSISGTVVRCDKGTKRNPVGNSFPDINNVPKMARDTLKEMRLKSPLVSACINSSRGCPHNCTFCSTPVFYHNLKRYRKRSPIDVVNEIESVCFSYDVHLFTFCDDNFIIPGKKYILWAHQFADELIHRQLPIAFSIMLRAEFFRPEYNDLLIKLKQAGLHQVLIGFESATENTLTKYNKRTNIKDYKIAIDFINENFLFLSPAFINFNPYLTDDDFVKNIEFLASIVHHPLLFHYITRIHVFPGTEFSKKLKSDNLLIPNDSLCISELQYGWKNPIIDALNEGLARVSINPYLPDELFDETHHLLSYLRAIRKITDRKHEEIFKSIKESHRETAKKHYSILLQCLDAAKNKDSAEVEQIIFSYYSEKSHGNRISIIKDELNKIAYD